MMDELWTKRPAEVVRRPVYPMAETITAPLHRRADLVREIHAAQRRGELGPDTSEVREIRNGWAVKVVRLRDPIPAWRRALPWVVVGLALLALASWAVVQLVTAMVLALAGAVSAAGPLVLLGLLVLCLAGAGRASVTVVQKVTIK